MGYADGYYYGQGRIRVDTSMFSVGDTIRVRSMTDSTKIYDKAVVTVGTPLIFTVPPYDTYKVCEVQEINNVVTEIGGVEVNIGFGDFVNTTPLDTNSLAYVQSVLNNHQENYLLNIGDEKTIKLNVGGSPTDWVMQIAGINIYDTHEVIFVSKTAYINATYNSAGSGSATAMYYADSITSTSVVRKRAKDDFYNSIDIEDKKYLKTLLRSGSQANNGSGVYWKSFEDYVWIPNRREVNGASLNDSNIPKSQFPLFTTQANRIRTYNGNSISWWTCDGDNSAIANPNFWYISTGGVEAKTYQTASNYVLPCFRLTADS